LEHAFEDEYGGIWWIPGHHSPESAILSIVMSTMIDYGDEEAREFLVGGPVRRGQFGRLDWTESDQMDHARELLALPTHAWYKYVDDERFEPCEADDPEAVPFTRVDLN
jgi:hypothetical protein